MFQTGSSAAKRATKEQTEQLKKQKQIEEARLAEEEGELARKRVMTSSANKGRRSLIRTSETGVAARTTLG